jgi:NAD/NADP transhydrogenase beta subunit
MCESMNRSLANVIFGGFGAAAPAAGASAADAADKKPIATMSVSEVADSLTQARKVLIVPGYGLAVANAQHACSELVKMLQSKGVTVEFGIHPVAGRMPGQLNVLLAEAGVDYEIVKEMDEVNPRMEEYDVCLVLGANDVINSAAKEDPSSILAGMPVIEAWRAKSLVVSKRGYSAGYSGADNSSFYKENAALWLGDAKASLDALRAEVEGK